VVEEPSRTVADAMFVRANSAGLDAVRKLPVAVGEETEGLDFLVNNAGGLFRNGGQTNAGVEVLGSIGVITLGHARRVLDMDEAVALIRALQRETSLFVTEAVVEHGNRILDDQ
jgi:NAD(P)-dependent dehydrogenase (short-subunit alcohol dehydrogenase family)